MKPQGPAKYIVRLFQQFDSEQPVMTTHHDHWPQAEGQANFWKQRYPGMHIAIEERP